MRDAGHGAVFLSSGLRETDPVDVNFGNWLQLAGLRVSQDRAGILLRLHWRCLRKTYRPWRCFVHLLSGQKQISTLDHALAGRRPPVCEWECGDEAWQQVPHWLEAPPPELAIRLGLYDPQINTRCPILASTVPLVDEATAVLVRPGETPPNSGHFLRFEPAPLRPCGVVFEKGLELTACSLASQAGYSWLRMKWTMRGRARRGLRCFWHVVEEPTADAAPQGQFDQDLAWECRGPATAVEQHVIRQTDSRTISWLRAGVFRPSSLERLRIVASPLPADHMRRCFFLRVRE